MIEPRLRAALTAPDHASRLRELLLAWREVKAPELAQAIEAVDAALERGRPALGGKTVAARVAAWLELEKGHDPALTGWLLRALPLGATLTDAYRPRLRRIARWKADPRLAVALAALLDPPSFADLRELWDPVFRQLEACGDVRVIPRLEAAYAELAASRFFAPRIERTLAALKALPVARLGAREKKLLASVLATLPPSEDALLAAIWAAPADDAPRLVYADWLLEQRDPRGELIALQCRGQLDAAGKKRVRELLQRHKERWFGPLEPAVMEQKSYGYERGFLATCSVCVMWGANADDLSQPRERAIRALAEHPAWSTLREVRMAKLGLRTRAPLIAHLERLGVAVRIG